MYQDLSEKTQEQKDLIANEMISRAKSYLLFSVESVGSDENMLTVLTTGWETSSVGDLVSLAENLLEAVARVRLTIQLKMALGESNG